MNANRWTRALRSLTAVFAIGILSLAAASASATTMVYADVDRLTEISSLIVRGMVVDAETVVENDVIMTEWTLLVSETWKGAERTSVTFRQAGGHYEGSLTWIPGDAHFELGEECVLFLHDDGTHYYLSALGQSKFSVDDAPFTPDPPDIGDTVIPTVGPLQIERVIGETATLRRAVRDVRELAFFRRSPSGGEYFHIHELEVLSVDALRSHVRAAGAVGGE